MKKITRITFVLILLLIVVLPLAAEKAMVVTWQWALSDPAVTAYRYQIDGEKDGKWIVVDGRTDSYTASGLDPYKDYTLYLQCSYDGVYWSLSACSTAYAILSPEVEEASLPEIDVSTGETALVEEKKSQMGERVFFVFGYGIMNEWKDGTLISRTMDEGIVSAEDVEAFLSVEKEKYLLNDDVVSLVSDGFVLDYSQFDLDIETILDVYEEDLNAYILSLLSKEKEKSSDFSLFGYTFHNTYKGTTFESTVNEEGAILPGDILSFIDYENAKYSFLKDVVYVSSIEDGKLVLSVPEGLDYDLYIAEYKNEIFLYVSSLLERAKYGEIVKSEEVVEEVPVVQPITPVVEVKKSKETNAKCSFNLGFNGSFEFGYLEGRRYATCFPRFAVSLEAQNLIHFGFFGLGLRSDLSSVFIPESGTLKSINGKWGFDLTADIKLMGYFNFDRYNIYLGGGVGYSLATPGFANEHSSETQLYDMNKVLVATALLGCDFHLNDWSSFSITSYGRGIFNSSKTINEYSANIALGLTFKYR